MSGPLIPYIVAPEIHLTFLTYIPLFGDAIDPASPPSLKPFGTLVGLGVYAGIAISMHRCRQRELDSAKLTDFIYFVVGFGFVVSHMLDAIFYHPHKVAENPFYLLRVWDGLSSYGGFIGAAVGAIVWHYVRKANPWEYVDVTASAFPVAWVFGRMGCSVVHDHPGAPSNAWFAVQFPEHQLVEGFAGRFDLGLIEMVLTIPLAIIVTILWRRKPKRAVGFFLGFAFVAYSPVRFVLDFLRVPAGDPVFPGATDPRYAGLTPAQWACFGALFFGIWLLRRSLGKPYKRLAPAAPDSEYEYVHDA